MTHDNLNPAAVEAARKAFIAKLYTIAKPRFEDDLDAVLTDAILAYEAARPVAKAKQFHYNPRSFTAEILHPRSCPAPDPITFRPGDRLPGGLVVADENVIADALAGWRYIRQHHGDLYGVAWDRVQIALAALAPQTKETETNANTQ